MSTNRLALGLLLASIAACGGGARSAGSGGAAASEYTQQVKGYLDRLSDNAVKQGYGRVVAGPVYGSLADDAKGSHDMTVVAGREYVLFGACDNDCTDLDLLIYDGSGDLVRRDVATDDRPVLIFTAAKAGKYRIQVVMATCSDEPCRYGLQLNSK
jgi:hypothetical protein